MVVLLSDSVALHGSCTLSVVMSGWRATCIHSMCIRICLKYLINEYIV